MKKKFDGVLTDYFLTRSYHVLAQPFATIMDFPREEGNTLTAKFTTNVSDKGNYYDHRRMVEKWLHTEAEQVGTQIKNPRPLYFFLTSEQMKQHDDALMRYISIPVRDIDLTACSLTIGDSFCNHQYLITNGQDSYGQKENAFLGRVLNSKDSRAILEGHRTVTDQREGYVEIQMWDRPPTKFLTPKR